MNILQQQKHFSNCHYLANIRFHIFLKFVFMWFSMILMLELLFQSCFIFSGYSFINKSTTQSSDTGADTLKDKILYIYEETHMKVWIYSNSLSWIWMCVPVCYFLAKENDSFSLSDSKYCPRGVIFN